MVSFCVAVHAQQYTVFYLVAFYTVMFVMKLFAGVYPITAVNTFMLVTLVYRFI
jgi:hypothetical protein